MTYKEKCEFLESIIQLDIIIENLIGMDSESLYRCCNTTISTAGDGAQNGKGENSVENKIGKYLESKEKTREKINRYIDQYIDAKDAAEAAINALDLEYHDVMILYYIQPKLVEDEVGETHKRRNTLDDIARITFTDRADVSRKKQAAIDKINFHGIPRNPNNTM
ncbi:MAG: hypothetical protein QM689_12675 [Oscillospiraceae bacterium]